MAGRSFVGSGTAWFVRGEQSCVLDASFADGRLWAGPVCCGCGYVGPEVHLCEHEGKGSSTSGLQPRNSVGQRAAGRCREKAEEKTPDVQLELDEVEEKEVLRPW